MIGNPPYGANLSKDKEFIKEKFIFVHQRTIDSYNFFIALSSILLKIRGTCFYIIPSAFLFQNEFSKSRCFLIAKNTLIVTLNLGENIFKAVVPSCIIGYNKGINLANHVFIANLSKTDLTDVYSKGYELKYSELLKMTDYIIPLDIEKQRFLEKIYKNDTINLDFLCEEVNSGITSGDLDIFNVNKSEISKIFSYNLKEFSQERILSFIQALLENGALIDMDAAYEKIKKYSTKLQRKFSEKVKLVG